MGLFQQSVGKEANEEELLNNFVNSSESALA